MMSVWEEVMVTTRRGSKVAAAVSAMELVSIGDADARLRIEDREECGGGVNVLDFQLQALVLPFFFPIVTFAIERLDLFWYLMIPVPQGTKCWTITKLFLYTTQVSETNLTSSLDVLITYVKDYLWAHQNKSFILLAHNHQ